MSEGHKKRIRNTCERRSLLIVTTSDIVSKVIKNIDINDSDAIFIAGIALLDKDMRGTVMNGINVVADYHSVTDYVCREWIDEVFISISENNAYPEKLIERFVEMGVVVRMELMHTCRVRWGKQFVEQIGNYTVLTAGINCVTAGQAFMKRAMDIAGGIVGCIITGLLTLFIGPIVYMQSPGPIFFCQVRVGKNGKKFKIYKFRSMYMDAEERKAELMEGNRVAGGMMFKLDHDPRIIGSEKGTGKGIGNFIRKTSIDEFPQFWNVLKGEMSLVGTRPPTIDEWEKYDFHHRARLATKPGITGMWQVSGRSEITDFEEVVRLDTSYIENWSFGLDLRILLKTVSAVLKRDGSM